MSTTQAPRSSTAIYAAYAAAVLFALHLATYFVPALRDATLATAASLATPLAVLAVAQHLVVFPVVAALPAPRRARAAAYIWLVVDMGTDLLQLGGASKSVYLVIRLAVNVLAALWIASTSWRARLAEPCVVLASLSRWIRSPIPVLGSSSPGPSLSPYRPSSSSPSGLRLLGALWPGRLLPSTLYSHPRRYTRNDQSGTRPCSPPRV